MAFGVFEHLVGSYGYRIVVGTWSQWHYLSYIRRFARCMEQALGRSLARPRSPMHRAALRRYLQTWSPRYDPAKVEIPARVDDLLARYTAMAESGQA